MSLVRQGVSLAFSKVLFFLLGYILTFYIAKLFGAEALGNYILIYSILSVVISFVPLGLKDGLMYKIPLYINEKSFDEARSFFTISFILSILIGVTLWILIIPFDDHIIQYFNLSIQNKPLLKWFSGIVLFEGVSLLISGGIRGFGDYKFFAIGTYVLNIFRLIALGFILIFPISNFPVEFTYFVAAVLTFLFYIYTCFKLQMFGKILKTTFVPFKKVLYLFFPIVITGFLLLLQSKIDRFALGRYCSIKDIGVYSIAQALAGLSSFFLIIFNSIFAPKISTYFANNNMKELSEIYRISIKWLSFFNILFISVMIFCGLGLLNFYGEEFQNGYKVLIIISVGQMINSITGVSGQLLNMIGMANRITFFSLISVVITLVLCYFFVPKYGIIGAGVAVSIALLVYNLLCIIFVKKHIGIHPFNREFLNQFISGIVCLIFFVIIKLSFFDSSNFYISIMINTIFLFFYCLLQYLFFMKEEEKAIILRFFKNKIGK
ncbi:hypothetical protein KO02_22585 [Sphingobacterium sp. ML3W]|uniref:MATE family efflux transporter n=1 Tax=Sphingobacterium sp. ML3W TaxID=1538644 RepID=UPI0004F79BA6|nr:MATE family efflux transporter [Sphingobacterium sp. ML3W]AIM39156.1 hypothetical protein KO02_22585 [Sphingobacterium sp. ML3W]